VLNSSSSQVNWQYLLCFPGTSLLIFFNFSIFQLFNFFNFYGSLLLGMSFLSHLELDFAFWYNVKVICPNGWVNTIYICCMADKLILDLPCDFVLCIWLLKNFQYKVCLLLGDWAK
jgi:hypothetical protein